MATRQAASPRSIYIRDIRIRAPTNIILMHGLRGILEQLLLYMIQSPYSRTPMTATPHAPVLVPHTSTGTGPGTILPDTGTLPERPLNGQPDGPNSYRPRPYYIIIQFAPQVANT